ERALARDDQAGTVDRLDAEELAGLAQLLPLAPRRLDHRRASPALIPSPTAPRRRADQRGARRGPAARRRATRRTRSPGRTREGTVPPHGATAPPSTPPSTGRTRSARRRTPPPPADLRRRRR